MLTPLIKLLTATTIAILASLVLAQTAQAKDFQADYDISYTLNPQANLVRVKQQISLTNKRPNMRASSYSLILAKDSYKNITARDSGGAMNFTEKDSDGNKIINFTFNARVVGVGNRLTWTIEYDSTNMATHNGLMWDISVPRVQAHDSYDIGNYTASIITPASVGQAHYLTPQPARTSFNDQTNSYIFNKDQIMPAGILASFGKAQVFDFTLIYHLKNPQIGQVKTEIALPPDIIGYQQIIHSDLNPKPASLRTDQDGNTLAMYYLGPQATLDVTFTGHARIDQAKSDLNSPALISAIPDELVENYTIKQKYWETDDQQIKDEVAKIVDPAKPAVENARAIYQFVTKKLSYNTARIDANLARMGASAAYRDPKNAVCMEFTDLFITMARLAGIPAREIDGYAYTTGDDAQPIYYPELGSDILHAWAQIYLPDVGWVMVDPTWGSTTGGVDFFGQVDLNRIAFAIKGMSSESPYAAGAYKTNADQDGDVQVSFSKTDQTGQAKLQANITTVEGLEALTKQPKIVLSNTGNTTIYNLDVDLKRNDPNNYLVSPNQQIGRLLPGQTIELDIDYHQYHWFTGSQVEVELLVKGQDMQGQVLQATDKQSIVVPSILTTIFLPTIAFVAAIAALTALIWFILHRAEDWRSKLKFPRRIPRPYQSDDN